MVKDPTEDTGAAPTGAPALKYQRVIRYVLETPWAIHPPALGAILEVLAFRADGGQFTDEEIAERLAAAETVEASRRSARRSKSVAILPLTGTIFPRANLFTEMSGGTSLQRFSAMLAEVANDDEVGSIVLDVASPGGMIDLVPETAEQVRQVSKPVVAVANAQAASAAYWIAAQADELVVTPSGQVGSVGVWSAHEDWSLHEGNFGVTTTLISAGRYKVEGNPFGPLDDEARAAMQKMVDTYYDMFIDAVARGRDTSTTAVRHGFGEGRMVTAHGAVREGMADRVASLSQVVTELVQGHTPRGKALRTSEPDATGNVDLSTPPPDPQPEEESEFYLALLEHL